MKNSMKAAMTMAGILIAGQASAQIVFFERAAFEGRSFSTRDQVRNFDRYGFNDRASSIEVVSDQWQVCDDINFRGRCVVLPRGRYPSLAAMGLNDRISSARMVSENVPTADNRYGAIPMAGYSYQRRNEERLFEANVTSVRAVVGAPEQRCWIEREQVPQERSGANVPGAIAGALIGGILGHQIGGGRGQDLATAGGAVAGAAVGANVGRDGDGRDTYSRNVQRCSGTPGQVRPEYWDVTYEFQGLDHRVQLRAPPGPTVTVNGQGEPRE
jgi:uncharacterized protein YcfJ